jgi:hypothetical protein
MFEVTKLEASKSLPWGKENMTLKLKKFPSISLA